MERIHLNSMEARLTLILLVAMLVPTGLVASIAYGRLIDEIRTERVKTVGRVSDARHEQLVMVLQRAIGRSEAILKDVSQRCGRLAPNADCGRQALQSFISSDGALGAVVSDPEGDTLSVGDSAVPARDIPTFSPGQLAQVVKLTPGTERKFFVAVTDPITHLRMAVTYSARFVQPIFGSHADLGESGETFLGDSAGFFITDARYASAQGHIHPISAVPMERCLKAENAETLDLDYRNVPIIHGFRFVPEIGGGCIMAHIDQAEAFAPLESLKMQFFLAMLMLAGVVIATAKYVARRVATPIKQLTEVARSIATGDVSVRVTPSGCREVVEMAGAFNAMTDRLAEVHAGLERRVVERTESLRLLSSVFQHSGEGIIITDADNRVITANHAFTRLTGYSLEDVQGHNPKMLSAGRTPKETYQKMWHALNAHGLWEGELWDRRKSGEPYPKWASIAAVRTPEGEPSHYIASFSDITERKESEERVLYLAHHDALTQLPNRLNLQDRLEQTINFAERNAKRLALMLIDLDRFKTINDTLGHHVGDQLLIEVAERLRSAVRSSDIVARLGGDEFVVVVTEMESIADAALIAEKIVAVVSAPYGIADGELGTSPSIGICIWPDDASAGSDLLKHADVAMYRAKAKGRGTFEFFSAGGVPPSSH